jgi:hypothetical protein
MKEDRADVERHAAGGWQSDDAKSA